MSTDAANEAAPIEPETRDPLIGTVVAERFRVERLLGEGGMGRVYVAEHTGIGKRVALKCLNPELAGNKMVVDRFVREARAAAAAGNEHIVDVFDLGTLDDGAPFIVMELLSGKELRDVLDDEGPLPIGRAIGFIRQVCDALAPVHAKGIVHRDLKPENIFLAERKRNQEFVKVLDFGISKLTEPGSVQKLTGTGMTLGTPHYMSPEQAQGLPSVDHRTDVYALGVILYEMLAGKLPFDAETFPLLVVGIVTQDAPSIRRIRHDVPVELADAIDRCLAKSPEARFADVDGLSEALATFEPIDAQPVLAGMAPTIRPPNRQEAALPPPPATPSDEGESKSDSAPVTQALGGTTKSPDSTPLDATRKSPPSLSSRRRVWTLGAAGIGLGIVGLVAFALAPKRPAARDSEETQAPPATPVRDLSRTAEAEPTPENRAVAVFPQDEQEIRLRIVAAPAAARVFIDDVEFPNPLDLSRARADVPVRVRIASDGYQTHEELVVLDRDVEMLRTLDPVEGRRNRNPRSKRPSRPVRPATPVMNPATPVMEDRFRDDF